MSKVEAETPPNKGQQGSPSPKAPEFDSTAIITNLAETLSDRQILVNHIEQDPQLDFRNPKFDPYRWAHAMIQFLGRDDSKRQSSGVVFSNMSVSGSESGVKLQETVLSSLVVPFRNAATLFSGRNSAPPRRILEKFDGLLRSGELLLVLGRPGSGCTTFLKTICGHSDGLNVDSESKIRALGLNIKDIRHRRGDVAYNQEVDEHFPHLTVGQTLRFATAAKAPLESDMHEVTRSEYVDIVTRLVMAIFGLSHTVNTKVGDAYVRGVSGGERKRVSIAEMFVARIRMGAWDNCTRGLDAASALQFVRSLRLTADLDGTCHAVAAYQASQAMYELFDKVIVLYEGKEIFYGPCDRAVAYFQEMGWERDERQEAPDFLTAITNPGERQASPGMEDRVPRTPAEFVQHWERSPEYRSLQSEVAEYLAKEEDDLSTGTGKATEGHLKRRSSSPYLLSVPMQTRLCLERAGQRMRNDLATTVATVVVQTVLALIIGSIFFNSPDSSSAFFQKGAVLFFAVLMNALITINEIGLLYSQRPIIEKQARYAFVRPFTESLASVLVDLPIKLLRCSAFSIILYFMSNLRREPGPFFIFYLFLITAILAMSAIFRSLAASTKTVGQAMGLAGIIVLCIVVYTGFTVPQTYMHPWLSWIRWINPIFYAFEALVSNEFRGRDFDCAAFVPPYGSGNYSTCSSVGSEAGQPAINGDFYIKQAYGYDPSHLWRNYGILFAITFFFYVLYLTIIELAPPRHSTAEALVYRPGHAPQNAVRSGDVEDQNEKTTRLDSISEESYLAHLPKQTDVLTWRNINYDIPTKDGTRRLLHNVNGWIKPGTLTALMGVSGAGKTTLLDVLAKRVSIGVVTGDILVNGQSPSVDYPRRTGYVQQQDLHLETTTVREALQFSALLRQPQATPTKEKYAYVEEVIQMLGMHAFAEAVVGSPGSGLNVEQRKLLSIGVELVAKPTLLIFLDEPTSGLDSQSSWTICAMLRRLADHGQAVLATIHQPSALLFQTFDRLLFLAEGGRTVYFGDIGLHSQTLRDYFVKAGARPCGPMENPAEYILDVVNSGKGEGVDWVARWNESAESQQVLAELTQLEQAGGNSRDATDSTIAGHYALPFFSQLFYVSRRVFQQYYRDPQYIFAKFGLGIASGLFIGFSFWDASSSQQGFQNALFSIFLLCSIFSTLVNQIVPRFVTQRALYEVRERPSRVYSWQVFILSQMLVEVPWQVLLGVCAWACSFPTVFGTNIAAQDQGLVLLFVVQFYVYAASMAQAVIAGVEDAGVASMLGTLMFGLSFIFNGVMQPPDALPDFWIFMYRVSPFTYYIGGISSAALHSREVVCSSAELTIVTPPPGKTCGEYFSDFLGSAEGALYNPDASAACEYCAMSDGSQYLAQRRIYYEDRWRNYGIFLCYFVFNAAATISLYYLFRVRKWRARSA